MVQLGVSDAFVAKNFQCDFMPQTCALILPFQPTLHRVSCSNETIQHAPKHYKTHQYMTLKHEFMVQWGGSGVFVSKNSDATSWQKLLH